MSHVNAALLQPHWRSHEALIKRQIKPQVVIQKYQDHLPLYRIEQISARHGVVISRSTLAEWIGRIGRIGVAL